MRSMRHVKRGRNPKQRTGKNRTSTKNEAYKRHNAAKQQWIGKTQFWEPKSALSEKRLAEKVINESFHSAPVQNKVNARPKKVAEHKPSASQPKKALEPQQKNLKKNSAVEEVAQKKAVQKTEAVSNGVAGKLEKFAPKKKEVVEQLRVEINEKQYSDNDDMKSSVDSGVDVAHHKEDQKPENVLNGAERLAELTGEVVDAVDEEPCVLRKASRCGEFCGCDRIRDEHYHHDHDSVEDERIVEDPPKEAAVCETKQAKSAKKQKQEAKPAEANDSQSTRFSANVVKFVDMAQKKLAAPENAKETEPKIAPVTVTKAASAPAPTPASVVVKKVDPKRRERQYKLLPRDIEFCSYMMETHGENFEAMANDPKNVYRDTANGISRKLRIFRESPQYEEYVASKNV